ncbi:MAG: helix-turn-helix domain-containing protein [Candidatus Aenigmatarchaeota archaeon]
MDKKKQQRLNKIINALAANPDGLWLRQLSNETKTPVSTLHRYLENELKDITDNLGVKDKNGKYFGLRIVRLKANIIKIVESEGLDKLNRFLNITKRI